MSKSTVQYPRVTPTNKGAGNEGYNAPWSNVVTSEKARLIIVPTLLNKVSLRPTTPCDYPSQTIYQVFRLSMRQGFPTDKHKQNKSSNRESESSNLDIFLSLCIYIYVYIYIYTVCIYIYIDTAAMKYIEIYCAYLNISIIQSSNQPWWSITEAYKKTATIVEHSATMCNIVHT